MRLAEPEPVLEETISYLLSRTGASPHIHLESPVKVISELGEYSKGRDYSILPISVTGTSYNDIGSLVRPFWQYIYFGTEPLSFNFLEPSSNTLLFFFYLSEALKL